MIDLSTTRRVLDECLDLIESLDGQELDDSFTGPRSRHEETREEKRLRAERSKSLMLLAQRLAFAEQLVLNEYWYAKGEPDLLNPDRDKPEEDEEEAP